MVAFPPCKINLGLNVLRRRADGYHDIETCFYPVSRTDILEIVPAPLFSLTITGLSIPGGTDEADNLCAKAYRLLQRDWSIPDVAIHLHKMVPAGAGLGGGSSNGTWPLRLLNDAFALGLSTAQLAEYALQLGSDCPFFLYDRPMTGTGKGEHLSPARVSLKGKYLLLVRPDIHVSTQSAYQAVVPEADAPSVKSIIENLPISEWRANLKNHFEAFVMGKYPVIGRIRQDLYDAGALYASMSGSGSAVFGIFDSEVNLSRTFTSFDYWAGRLEV